GVGGDVGLSFLAEAPDRRRADEVGQAAHADRRFPRIVVLGGEQHRRDFEGLLVAVDGYRPGLALRRARRGAGRERQPRQSDPYHPQHAYFPFDWPGRLPAMRGATTPESGMNSCLIRNESAGTNRRSSRAEIAEDAE